ncbi:MAG: hypothetical protein KGZ79_00170 [Dethiobacter sp.]|jgi:hypothetical protein|nr:hypothetical protein [Dethiobacter sp.]
MEAYYANQTPFAYPENLADLVNDSEPYLRGVPVRLTDGWSGEAAKSDEAWGYQGPPTGAFTVSLPDNNGGS